MDRLQALLNLSGKLSDIFSRDDIMVAITDMKQFLHYTRSTTMDANIHHGQPFLKHDLFGTMFEQKSIASQIAPADYGAPFRAVGSPIYNDHHEIIGGIGFGIRLNVPEAVVQSIMRFSQLAGGYVPPSQYDSSFQAVSNHLCQACGQYALVHCATCPVEIRRQESILFQMRSLIPGKSIFMG